eukprot:scaffold114_cov200-Alexandrium_tamarense.AAC.57
MLEICSEILVSLGGTAVVAPALLDISSSEFLLEVLDKYTIIEQCISILSARKATRKCYERSLVR